MDAKEYLQSIATLDIEIDNLATRIEEQKALAKKTTSTMSDCKVQSSGSKQKMADAVCSYTVLEEEKKGKEAERQDIIDTIEMLKAKERAVIYQMYVCKKEYLGEIASNMGKSYSWVSKMHSNGIANIQAILDERKTGG